jgi:hypothetical protein
VATVVADNETTTYTETVRQHKLSPQDQSILYRLVGYYEYSNALDLLDQLLRISKPEEIAVYDKWVAERPEFTIYTNLSRLANEKPNAFSSIEVSSTGNEKRGLAWVMGLARLELLAMTSVYGSEGQLSSMRAPTAFENLAFRDLLFDGMRTHVWALTGDERFKKLLQKNPDAETIAYARRLTLVMRFVQSVAAFYGKEFTPEQRGQWTNWNRVIDDQKAVLLTTIESYLNQMSVSNDQQTTKYSSEYTKMFTHCMKDCSQKLAAIKANYDQ